MDFLYFVSNYGIGLKSNIFKLDFLGTVLFRENESENLLFNADLDCIYFKNFKKVFLQIEAE